MSALSSVQAAALLGVADVLEAHAKGIYCDAYGDTREYERDIHLRDNLLSIAESMRERASEAVTRKLDPDVDADGVPWGMM